MGLKEIDLPVVDSYQCENKLRQTRLGGKYKLHDSFLCAGGVSGKDTCKGDGGSPLVCPSKTDPNTYVQAGIVAWGIGLCEQSCLLDRLCHVLPPWTPDRGLQLLLG